MAHVICLVGPIASGKDKVYNACKQHFTPTKSITTRPVRESENGSEYIFTSNEIFIKMLSDGEILEFRKKDLNGKTIFYGIPFSSIDKDSNKFYLKPLDETGVKALKQYLGDDNVISIYLDCDQKIRKIRALNREPNKTIDALLKRFEDDRLTVEKFKNECDFVFKNESIKDLNYIINFILKTVKEEE